MNWLDQSFLHSRPVLLLDTVLVCFVIAIASVVSTRHAQNGVAKDAAGGYNFAVPSSGFHKAWQGHSAAVSSLSWIDSPPSLLSSSADGLAKIWKPDGSGILGQV